MKERRIEEIGERRDEERGLPESLSVERVADVCACVGVSVVRLSLPWLGGREGRR